MKKNRLLLAFATLLFLSNCSEDEEVNPRDVFLGTYLMGVSCTNIANGGGSANYSLEITRAANDNGIVLEDFLGSTQNIEARITAEGFAIDDETVVVEGNLMSVSGTGSLSGNQLSISYSFEYLNVNIANCTDTGAKQ